MPQDWKLYKHSMELHKEAIDTADRIKRLRGEMACLKQTQEESEALYFFSCGVARLELHLNNLRKQYHELAMINLERDKNAALQ